MQELRKTLRKIAAIGTSVAMLGMTVTGALAADLTLADYPKPFENGGKTVVIYGAAAGSEDLDVANDIITGLPAVAATTTTTTTTATTNAGTIELDQKYSKDIVIGTALSSTTAFGSEVRDTTLSGLKSGTAILSSSTSTATADYHERINFTSSAFVATGLTLGVNALNSSSERYGKNILLRFGQASMRYFYAFDATLTDINVANATTTNPTQLDFLGKTLTIEGVTSATKITAIAGDKFSMEAGDSVVVEGKKVTVESIGTTAARVTVDGVADTLSGLGSVAGATKTINGLSIRGQDLVDVGASTTAGKSSVTIVVSKASDTAAVKTYTDGDNYIGQNKNNPLWKWSLAGMTGTTPQIGVELGQSLTSTSISIPDYPLSHPPYVGDLLCLPNNYACITIEKISEDDDGFGEFQVAPTTTTLYNAAGTTAIATDAHAILIKSLSTTAGTGLRDNGGVDTSELYLYQNSTGIQTFRKDTTTSKPVLVTSNQLIGVATPVVITPGAVNYKSTNLPINLVAINGTVAGGGTGFDALSAAQGSYMKTGFANATSAGFFQAKLIFNQSTTTPEQIQIFLKTGDGATNWDHLGHRPTGGTYQSNDILYVPDLYGQVVDISAYSGDTRTGAGAVLSTVKSAIENDDLRIRVPKDTTNYKATVVLATTKGGSTPTVVKGTTTASASVLKKDTEVSDVTAYNAIVVGGPAINQVAASLMGKTFPAYGADSGLVANEAIIELKKNGSNYALIVAGWEAADTKRASVVLKNYATFKENLKGMTSVTVKGTGMDVGGITVVGK